MGLTKNFAVIFPPSKKRRKRMILVTKNKMNSKGQTANHLLLNSGQTLINLDFDNILFDDIFCVLASFLGKICIFLLWYRYPWPLKLLFYFQNVDFLLHYVNTMFVLLLSEKYILIVFFEMSSW